MLLRGGAPVDLSPRLADILGHLASHAGEIVTKEALLDRFWPDVHVADNTLTWSVTQIRKAIGDDPANPKFIQTVARRGYRFIAPVDASGAPAEPDAFEAWTKGQLVLEALDAPQLDQATASFERVLAANERYAPAHAALANAWVLRSERMRPDLNPDRTLLERARAHAQQACELAPTLAEARGTLAFVLLSMGEIEKAHAAARKATALQPESWRHQFRLALASWGQQRLNAVDRTLALMPNFAQARFLAAMVFVARQAFDLAEQHAAAGAGRSPDAADDTSPFPAFGLRWSLGLLHLRKGEIADALASFDREIAEGRRTAIYFREYRANALVGAGYAHLAAQDPAAAIASFRRVLDDTPCDGRARLGLWQACEQSGKRADAAALAPRVAESIDALRAAGRSADAALLAAAVAASRGSADEACAVLEQLLTASPPSQAGWIIPVDPALALLRGHARFERLLDRLAARAA